MRRHPLAVSLSYRDYSWNYDSKSEMIRQPVITNCLVQEFSMKLNGYWIFSLVATPYHTSLEIMGVKV